jgi:Methylase involved in ubiquinone/menaquinone biosynthesis
MYRSAYDLKAFYNTKTGRVVRRILQSRLRAIWPDLNGLLVMGVGYATPFLRVFMDEAERLSAVMPAAQGAHIWPHKTNICEQNRVCIAEESELPYENSSVDRILMIHHLEFSEFLQASLEEVWRVLKANGRVLVVVPNRSGLWARADWSPFGQGTPYSAAQIVHYLHDNKFVHEQTEEGLFMPPLKQGFILKSARLFENLGQTAFPMVAGVHIVEASKQLYARINTSSGSKVTVRGRGFVPRSAPQRP